MRFALWTTRRPTVSNNGSSLSPRIEPLDICLPSQLQTAVPSCALNCLQVFIANNYSNLDCSVTANLNLLCTTKTVSGLTIGEGALQCVVSNCPYIDLEFESGYFVCQGVPGAQPEMAQTITATVAFSASTPTDSATVSTTSTNAETVSENSVGSLTIGTVSTTSSVSSSLSTTSTMMSSSSTSSGLTSTSTRTTLITKPSSTVSIISTTSSSLTLPTSSRVTSISTELSTTKVLTATSIEHTSSAPASSATTAPVTEPPAKKQLSSSAVAGIATICVVVVGLLIAYLAYICYVKRRAKDRRRSHRFSSFFPPPEDPDESGPSNDAASTHSTQNLFVFAPNQRFYSPSNDYEKQESSWRRSPNPYPSEIGVAVGASTRVSPERSAAPGRAEAGQPLVLSPVSPMLQKTTQANHIKEDGRWSAVSSLDEHAEAHNQDLPVLASPRTRSSSRSFSSAGIEKPAPLKLNTKKTTQLMYRIPLTPTYDNGNYEPTVQRVYERPVGPPVIVRTCPEQQRMNFSRRQPSLKRRIDAPSSQLPVQLQDDQDFTVPVRPINQARKESSRTDTTTSVYTEFDEDSTPEQEDDKQLCKTTRLPGTSRPPLRDLRWPQIPRSAATSKHAEKIPSPRAIPITRTMSPTVRLVSSEPWLQASNSQSPSNDHSLKRFTVSSTESDSACSISAVFPMPPPRNPLRVASQPRLTEQIHIAYMAASRPTTTTTPTKMSKPRPARAVQVRYPVASTNSQLLRTDTPVVRNWQSQGYIPPR